MDNGTLENNVKIGKYFVLLVDLLGQNEFLASDFFDSNGNLIAEQQEKANQVTDQILYIKRFFDGAFNSLKNPNPNIIKFLQEFSSGLGTKINSEQIGEELKETFKLHLKTQQFSDTILCYLEIPHQNLIFCYNIMIVWMTILVELMRDSLFKHLPIRGVITCGYGWEIETIVKLIDGSIWQQNDYAFSFSYSYCPKVYIFNSNGRMKMKVDGLTERKV